MDRYPMRATSYNYEDGINFFMLSKRTQEQHSILTITDPPFAISPPKHRCQLQDIAWHEHFEHRLGIVDYTAAFVRVHGKQGIVVTRRAVEQSWVKAVKKRFKYDRETQDLFVSQVNCALINDCWARREFDLRNQDNSLIEDPNGVRDATALRVLRWPMKVNGQMSTIMLLDDNKAPSDMSNRTEIKAADVVILPFLGLDVLENINYLDLAAKVRRGDKKPVREGLMKAVWRGVIFNLFYFEDEELKLSKVAEEAWIYVERPWWSIFAKEEVGGAFKVQLNKVVRHTQGTQFVG
ncbi:MAG: hypothetical protein Q9195_006949 [Heterodermia aff. obscurata]